MSKVKWVGHRSLRPEEEIERDVLQFDMDSRKMKTKEIASKERKQ